MKPSWILVLAFACLVGTASGQVGCGNGQDGGVSKPAAPNKPDDPNGGDPFNAYSANDSRKVTDISLFAGVGQHKLAFTRYTNSRFAGTTQLLGSGSSVRHSYQWDMADYSAASNGAAQLNIIYPDGNNYIFTQVSSTQWNSTHTCEDILTQSGTAFTLQRKNGWQYHFATLTSGSSHYYQMQSFTDSAQNVYPLTYDSNNRVIQVAEPAGRTLTLTYGTSSIEGSTTASLVKVTAAPAAGQWVTLPLSYSPTYRYLYISTGANTAGTAANPIEIAELQFLDASGNVISGTPFGSAPSDPSTSPAQAFDGDSTTYDESVPTPYVGLDLGTGTPAKAKSVRILARSGYESLLYGVYVKGSNVTPGTVPVLTQVAASDGRAINYTYQQVTNQGLPYSYVVLAGAAYPDATSAQYTYTQTLHDSRPLATDIVDPRYALPFAQIHTDYYSTIVGAIASQAVPGGGPVLTTLGASAAHVPVVSAVTSTGATASMTYYMGNGVLDSKKDYLNRLTTYTHAGTSSDGFLTAIKDPLNHTTTITPSASNNPLAITHPDGTAIAITRDSLDLPLVYTDENSHATTFTRDTAHRITQIAHPDASTETFVYNTFGQVTSHTLRNGQVETASYDSSGRLLTKTDATGHTTTVGSYDGLDRPASVTDANGNTEQFVYNDRGQITLNTHADGSTHAYTYDTFGDKTSETNELGQTWTYAYDGFKRLASSTDPLNRTTTYTYGSSYQNKPVAITLPSGKQETYTYDAEWQLLTQTVGAGTADAATTTYTYDKAGNVTSVTDPRGKIWSTTYDTRNRKLTATDPLAHVTKWTYDAAGNVLTVTRANGGVTTNTYNSMNRLLTTQDPKGEITTMTYDTAGNLLTRTDAKSNTYTYTYDHLNRVTSLAYPDGSHEDYGYDAVGNPVSYTNRAGVTKTSVFDNRNREVSYTWSDGTPGVTRTFDVAGHLLSSANGVSTTAYSYDVANERLSETQTSAVLATPWELDYTYDLDGNRASLTYPSGTMVSYGYTNRNQVGTISVGGSAVATYTYDANGNPTAKLLADGTTAGYTYDAANRLTDLNHTLAGVSFAKFDYGYDTVNRRTFEQRDGATGDVFGYDAIDQVTGVKYDATNPGGAATAPARTVGYAYDATGNRTAVTDTVNGNASYTTNNLNQYTALVTSSQSLAMSYDGNGNLSGGNGIYLYDAQNRLESASVGGNVDTFYYDSKNRVIERTVNGVTSYLVYDGWDLIEERDATGALLATYIHGVRQDELLSKTDAIGSTVYYHHNALGSVVNLTNSSGGVVEKYKYDVFGRPAITDGSGSPLTATAYGNRFLFTGREWLAEVSLYDYRNRVYSADLGRFLQTDPIRFSAGDVNIYRYCGNNGVNKLDWLGLCQNGSTKSVPAGFVVGGVYVSRNLSNATDAFGDALDTVNSALADVERAHEEEETAARLGDADSVIEAETKSLVAESNLAEAQAATAEAGSALEEAALANSVLDDFGPIGAAAGVGFGVGFTAGTLLAHTDAGEAATTAAANLIYNAAPGFWDSVFK